MNQDKNNLNSNNFNSKSPKKMNLGLIMVIVAVVAVVGVGIVFGSKLLSNGGSNNNSNNGSATNNDSSNQNLSSESISQIEIDPLFVITLTNSGKLYAIGYNSYYWGNTNKINLKETTLIAENVKSFSNDGRFYISNDDELYISGVNYSEGGVYKQYKKVASNINKVTGTGIGYIALSNDGTLYAYGDKDYSGFGQKYDELTLINNISNVKDVHLSLTTVYYLTNNNELYAKTRQGNEAFEKILDNVESCNLSTITTKDGKIYQVVYDSSTKKVVAKLVEGANGVITSSAEKQYYTKDNVILDAPNYNYESYRYYYPKDVKTMFFVTTVDENNKYIMKFAYLDNNNKLKLHYIEMKKGDYKTKLDEKVETLDYDTKNLATILEFSSNSTSKRFLSK